MSVPRNNEMDLELNLVMQRSLNKSLRVHIDLSHSVLLKTGRWTKPKNSTIPKVYTIVRTLQNLLFVTLDYTKIKMY
jgi:hypothetical protein